MNEQSKAISEFLPRVTFWKVIGYLITVVTIVTCGIASMSIAMDSSIMADVKDLEDKVPIIERIDERTINMEKNIDKLVEKIDKLN